MPEHATSADPERALGEAAPRAGQHVAFAQHARRAGTRCADAAGLADPRRPAVLTIAGSDSGGGAGIQADLRTFAAHRIHGLSAVTALTAQHTRAVTAVAITRPALIAAQIDAVFDDFDIRALKIGMLGNRATIRCVARVLSRQRRVPVVLDPVMVASSGAALLARDAIEALRAELLPIATLLTPNAPEAELLLGRRIRHPRALAGAARDLQRFGPQAVLLKGGHVGSGPVADHLVGPDGHRVFEHPRLDLDGHGTGCTLSAAIAANLAAGRPLARAVEAAIGYVHRALRHAYRPGRGSVSVLGHLAAAPRDRRRRGRSD
jgi:hydroxymethylpyrimidine/phosphomethylpyrimidine kinase